MGIHFLKYLSEILQLIALILCTGSLTMVVVVLYPYFKKLDKEQKFFLRFFLEVIHTLEYFYIFSIIFLWSGILIHITTASNNPLKQKLFILYLLLSGLMSLFIFIKVFWIQHSLAKSEKSFHLFSNSEIQTTIEKRIDNYKRAYYYLSVVNLLLVTTIILLKQY